MTQRFVVRACWLSAAAVALLWCSRLAAEEPFRPDKTGAELLCVTDAWAVWRTSELDERTRRNRAPTFTHRFYRQRLSDREASLVHTERDARVSTLATVTANGTVVLVRRGRLSWHPAEGESVTEPQRVDVAALFPDGAVLHKTTGLAPQPVYYVPFKDDRLDRASQIELIPARTRRFSFTGSPVVRHGDVLAWILTDPPAGDASSPADAWDATLHTYDLKSNKRKTVKLERRLHHSYRATALDDETVMAFSYVFDVASGKCLNAAEYPDRPNYLRRVFAIHNRIGYYVQDGSLYATDLLSAESPSFKVAPAAEPLVATTGEGLIAWDGTDWKTVRWLRRLPRNAE